MTTRESFEDWYEVDCYPCEHSNWFRLDSDGDYAFDEVQSAWRTWQAATAAALAAPATAPAQPERKPMHEGEIQAAWLGQDLDESIPYTFVLGIRSAERFNGIKEDKP